MSNDEGRADDGRKALENVYRKLSLNHAKNLLDPSQHYHRHFFGRKRQKDSVREVLEEAFLSSVLRVPMFFPRCPSHPANQSATHSAYGS